MLWEEELRCKAPLRGTAPDFISELVLATLLLQHLTCHFYSLQKAQLCAGSLRAAPLSGFKRRRHGWREIGKEKGSHFPDPPRAKNKLT